MALLLVQKTVTEIHGTDSVELSSVIVITLRNGRQLFVNEINEETRSITVQLRSFSKQELYRLVRHLHDEVFTHQDSHEFVEAFFKAHCKVLLYNTLATHAPPFRATRHGQLYFDHTHVIRPRFVVMVEGYGSQYLHYLRLKDFSAHITSIMVEE